MACEQYQEQFTDFLEGTLPEPSWRELELHLQQCERCAAAIKDFRRTVSALRGLALEEPPRTLARAIAERIAQEASSAAALPAVRVRTVTRRGFPWSAAGALAAACLVVAVVTVYSVRRPSAPLTTPSPPGPGVETANLTPPTAEGAPAEASPAQPAPSGAAAVAPLGPAPRAVASAPRSRPSRTVRGSGTRASAPVTPTANVGSPTAPPPVPTAEQERDAAVGPASPSGPAGPGGPKALAMEATREAARTFGGAAAQRGPSGPVSMDIRVEPPGARQVGQWGPLSISLTAGGDVPQVNVRLVADSALQVQGSTQIYSGPLQARRPQRITAQVRAQQPGSHRLKIVLASGTAIANTSVDVYLRGYVRSDSVRTTQRCFRSVPLGQAVQAVGEDCGLGIEVEPPLSGRRVSADFSEGVSGVRALRVLAGMVGGKLSAVGDGYRIVAAD